jgi:hypothetical protein
MDYAEISRKRLKGKKKSKALSRNQKEGLIAEWNALRLQVKFLPVSDEVPLDDKARNCFILNYLIHYIYEQN